MTFFVSQNSIKSFSKESINSKYKKNDAVLQKTQLLLTNGIISLVQVMDKLLKKDDAKHESEIFDLATDSLLLLAYINKDISHVRRKFLKPALALKYKRLCSVLCECLQSVGILENTATINLSSWRDNTQKQYATYSQGT